MAVWVHDEVAYAPLSSGRQPLRLRLCRQAVLYLRPAATLRGQAKALQQSGPAADTGRLSCPGPQLPCSSANPLIHRAASLKAPQDPPQAGRLNCFATPFLSRSTHRLIDVQQSSASPTGAVDTGLVDTGNQNPLEQRHPPSTGMLSQAQPGSGPQATQACQAPQQPPCMSSTHPEEGCPPVPGQPQYSCHMHTTATPRQSIGTHLAAGCSPVPSQPLHSSPLPGLRPPGPPAAPAGCLQLSASAPGPHRCLQRQKELGMHGSRFDCSPASLALRAGPKHRTAQVAVPCSHLLHSSQTGSQQLRTQSMQRLHTCLTWPSTGVNWRCWLRWRAKLRAWHAKPLQNLRCRRSPSTLFMADSVQQCTRRSPSMFFREDSAAATELMLLPSRRRPSSMSSAPWEAGLPALTSPTLSRMHCNSRALSARGGGGFRV